MGITDILSLLGGLALFLYGMHMMSNGLEAAAGNRMKSILEKLTSNRIKGVLVGAVITAPTRTPLIRLEVSFSKIDFILFPAAASRPLLIICIPYRNSASPPSKESISVIPIVSFSFFLLFLYFILYYSRLRRESG